MIRIAVITHDAGMAANIGGAVESWTQVFEIEHPGLEAALNMTSGYQSKTLSVVREEQPEKTG